MRIPLALLVLLNSACAIGNYSPAEPARQSPVEPPSNQRELLSFSYIPECRDKLESNPENLPLQSHVLLDHLERYSGFMKVIVTLIPPAVGTHVNVYQNVGPYSSTWCTASSWSLGIIPCYFEGIAYETHFDVLVDNTLKQTYRYPIRRKAVNWIVLVPFFWVNFLTTQYEEALSANIDKFIADAKRDGVL